MSNAALCWVLIFPTIVCAATCCMFFFRRRLMPKTEDVELGSLLKPRGSHEFRGGSTSIPAFSQQVGW